MRRWIVAIAVLAILATSSSLWAHPLAMAPVHATVVAMVDVVGDGFRGSSEPVKLALVGGGLIAGSLRLRRRRREEETGD